MAVAFVQEFQIQGGDRSTTNYDTVAERLNVAEPPEGSIVHTAGFDEDAGVFRIFDVWTTREQGERFIKDQLGPIIGSMATAAQSSDNDFAPPNRETWYELHDSVTG